MQAGTSSLPKLDAVWHYAVAAPMRRSRRIIAKAFLILRHAFFKHAARVDHLTLRRSPGTDATAKGARAVVAIGFLPAEP